MGTDEQAQRSIQPLSVSEIFFTALFGVLGLIGLIFIIPQASRFKKDGFLLKHRKSWQIYCLAFGLKLAFVLILIIVATR
jgi:nitric oxide reductase large subunit